MKNVRGPRINVWKEPASNYPRMPWCLAIVENRLLLDTGEVVRIARSDKPLRFPTYRRALAVGLDWARNLKS